MKIDSFMELVELEKLLADELHCESKHQFYKDCTIHVVARKTSCIRPDGFFICQSSYESNMRGLASNGTCASCGRPARECWTVRPI